MEAKLRQEQRKNPTIVESHDGSQAAVQSALRPGISRFGSFIGSRKTEASQQNGFINREKELEESLVKEQTMRIAAEKKLKETTDQLEDLSVDLFSQANEMVVEERRKNAELQGELDKLQATEHQPLAPEDSRGLQKENARLKERIQVLEQREIDRKRRLERLEAANKRVERVRAMLAPP